MREAGEGLNEPAIRSSGIPATWQGGCLLSWRVIAAWRPKKGLGDSTGKSDPFAMSAPASISLRHA